MNHCQEDKLMPDVTGWMTTSQVARTLGVSPTRVIQLSKKGRLPHVRVATGIRLYDPAGVRVEASRRAA